MLKSAENDYFCPDTAGIPHMVQMLPILQEGHDLNLSYQMFNIEIVLKTPERFSFKNAWEIFF